MKNLLFNLKVLYLSLRFPFWCMTIVIYSFTVFYLAMATFASFMHLNTMYFDLNNWNEFTRGMLMLCTMFMTALIINIRKK